MDLDRQLLSDLLRAAIKRARRFDPGPMPDPEKVDNPMPEIFGVTPRGTPHIELYAELQRICENHPGGRDELIQTLLFLVGGIVSGNESLPDEVRHWAQQAHDVILLTGKVR